jgi:transcriptional/translational regulatory protein YebC/TACO1
MLILIMAGHSKWHNIRFKKEKQDCKKAQLYNKYSKEITQAAQKGGIILENNSTLRTVIELAKKNGVPKDVITNALNKFENSNKKNAESLLFQCIGPGKSQLLISCFSSDSNKTCAKIKEILYKYDCDLNKCLFNFNHFFICQMKNFNVDILIESEAGNYMEDYETHDNSIFIYFKSNVLDILNNYSNHIENYTEVYLPINTITLDENNLKILNKINLYLEDMHEFQEIFTNIDNC